MERGKHLEHSHFLGAVSDKSSREFTTCGSPELRTSTRCTHNSLSMVMFHRKHRDHIGGLERIFILQNHTITCKTS